MTEKLTSIDYKNITEAEIGQNFHFHYTALQKLNINHFLK